MYAPHGHGQHLCYRVLSVACSRFLTVADIRCDVGATRGFQCFPYQLFSSHISIHGITSKKPGSADLFFKVCGLSHDRAQVPQTFKNRSALRLLSPRRSPLDVPLRMHT